VASGGEPVSSDIPTWFPENSDGPPVASGGEPVSSEMPTWFPENSDGPPVASGGEPVSSEIPTRFPENSDGPPVASGGQPVSSEIPTWFQEHSDGPPVASGGPSVAASSHQIMTCLYPVHSGAPVLDETVLDHFGGWVTWIETQKQSHMKWRTILNNHMTRRKELGGQICGFVMLALLVL
jgi:hypothetical protein